MWPAAQNHFTNFLLELNLDRRLIGALQLVLCFDEAGS